MGVVGSVIQITFRIPKAKQFTSPALCMVRVFCHNIEGTVFRCTDVFFKAESVSIRPHLTNSPGIHGICVLDHTAVTNASKSRSPLAFARSLN